MVGTTKEFLNLHLTLQLHHTVEDGLRTGRTARNEYVHGNDFLDTLYYVIALLEGTATDGAATNGNHILRLSHLIVQTLQCRSHLVCDSTSTHNQVGLTW